VSDDKSADDQSWDPPEHQEPLELTDEDFQNAAQTLGCDVAAIKAVAQVESSGKGFLPDGRATILYEAHIFGRLTNNQYANTVDARGKPISARSWDRSLYGPTGAHQYDRMNLAAQHNEEAAHQAASWGIFQILGTNYKVAGYDSIQEFVKAMQTGAGCHLEALVCFIQNNNLVDHLKNHNWAAFARAYNGPGYAQNRYDEKLAEAYKAHA
jgi:hypothetical protein